MSQGYSYEWDEKYCHPNSFILKNKFNITDGLKLEIAEKEYTSLNIAEIKVNPIKGNLDLRHIQDIHEFVFKDIYNWAGKLRTVNISKGTPFCNFLYIENAAAEIFTKLKNEDYLIGVSNHQIYYRLAYYLWEINALHPFREGNGRVQRILIEYLAQVAGFRLDFADIRDKEMINASIDAFNCDYDKMTEIFKKITKPIIKEEQEDFIKKISTKDSPMLRVYKLKTSNKPLE